MKAPACFFAMLLAVFAAAAQQPISPNQIKPGSFQGGGTYAMPSLNGVPNVQSCLGSAPASWCAGIITPTDGTPAPPSSLVAGTLSSYIWNATQQLPILTGTDGSKIHGGTIEIPPGIYDNGAAPTTLNPTGNPLISPRWVRLVGKGVQVKVHGPVGIVRGDATSVGPADPHRQGVEGISFINAYTPPYASVCSMVYNQAASKAYFTTCSTVPPAFVPGMVLVPDGFLVGSSDAAENHRRASIISASGTSVVANMPGGTPNTVAATPAIHMSVACTGSSCRYTNPGFSIATSDWLGGKSVLFKNFASPQCNGTFFITGYGTASGNYYIDVSDTAACSDDSATGQATGLPISTTEDLQYVGSVSAPWVVTQNGAQCVYSGPQIDKFYQGWLGDTRSGYPTLRNPANVTMAGFHFNSGGTNNNGTFPMVDVGPTWISVTNANCTPESSQTEDQTATADVKGAVLLGESTCSFMGGDPLNVNAPTNWFDNIDTYERITCAGFGVSGPTMGNNAWNSVWSKSTLDSGSLTNYFDPQGSTNTGENFVFQGSTIINSNNSGFWLDGGVSVTAQGTECDYSQNCIYGTNGQITFDGFHIEQNSAPLWEQWGGGSIQVSLVNGSVTITGRSLKQQIASLPQVGDKVYINGVTVTFGVDFAIGSTTATAAANEQAFLSASTDPNLGLASYTVNGSAVTATKKKLTGFLTIDVDDPTEFVITDLTATENALGYFHGTNSLLTMRNVAYTGMHPVTNWIDNSGSGGNRTCMTLEDVYPTFNSLIPTSDRTTSGKSFNLPNWSWNLTDLVVLTPGQQFTINGHTFTAVASGAGTDQVNVGVSLADQALQIQLALSASTDPNVLRATYSQGGAVVTVTPVSLGFTPTFSTTTTGVLSWFQQTGSCTQDLIVPYWRSYQAGALQNQSTSGIEMFAFQQNALATNQTTTVGLAGVNMNKDNEFAASFFYNGDGNANNYGCLGLAKDATCAAKFNVGKVLFNQNTETWGNGSGSVTHSIDDESSGGGQSACLNLKELGALKFQVCKSIAGKFTLWDQANSLNFFQYDPTTQTTSIGSGLHFSIDSSGNVTGGASESKAGYCTGVFGASVTYVMLGMGANASSTNCNTAATGSGGMGIMFPYAATLKNLSVRCSATATAGVTWQVFKQALGAGSFSAPASTLSVLYDGTVSAGSLQQDTTHTVSLNAGDLFRVQTTTGAGETMSTCSIAVQVSH